MPEPVEISLPSSLDSVEVAAKRADEFVKECGMGDEMAYAVDLAVRESVANAVKHGNKYDDAKNVELRFANDDGLLEITVRDHGVGFDVADVPDPTNPDNLLKANGRGILFMNSFMDSIEWSNHSSGGTVVKMTKKCTG